MKAHLGRIGNSRGIRLPKLIIKEAGLTDEVEVQVREGAIIIAPSVAPRSGWAEAAKQLRKRDEDHLLDLPTPMHFDEQEWKW